MATRLVIRVQTSFTEFIITVFLVYDVISERTTIQQYRLAVRSLNLHGV